jgi:hypothetical protein
MDRIRRDKSATQCKILALKHFSSDEPPGLDPHVGVSSKNRNLCGPENAGFARKMPQKLAGISGVPGLYLLNTKK